VTVPDGLAADLRALSAAVDDPGIDIADTLAQLGGAAAAGVESYLGLCVTVTGGATGVQLSTLPDQGVVVGSSVVIPVTTARATVLPALVISLVLYASVPGAFVDVAADLAWMTGRGMSDFRLDQHLMPPPPAPTAGGVRALTMINQAIGVLIGRGRTPGQAVHDLTLLAARADADLPAAAASILDDLT
jgi:hypothetical protein